MSRSYKRIVALLGMGFVVALAGRLTGEAHHAVLRFNIEEMTATADRILVGRCVSVEQTEEMISRGPMPVTRYTFEVERAIKGRLPRQITFRQLGHPTHLAGKVGVTIHGRAAGPNSFLHGMTEYRVGDRYVLFLIPSYLGGTVTYPVGLYQGAFFIAEMPSGQKLARNSINNLGLFTAPYNGTKMKEVNAKVVFPQRGEAALIETARTLSRKRGALPLDQFLELVEHIVAAHGDPPGAVVESKRGAIRQ